jgi:uncharacterized protein (TIGR02001 family)
MTKKILITALCIILSASVLSTHLHAGFEFGLDFYSRYIWRGFDLNPDNKPVLQPSVTYSFGDTGFSVNFWGSLSYEDKGLNETDITLSYEFKQIKNISLSVGFIHYGWYFSDDFSFKDHTTQELYVSAGFDKLPLKPTLTLYYDINNGEGLYALLGIGHGIKVSDSVTLDLAASLGYNGGQWVEDPGFSDLNLVVSIPLQLNKLSISPFLGSSIILMDEVNPEVENEIYFGFSLAF